MPHAWMRLGAVAAAGAVTLAVLPRPEPAQAVVGEEDHATDSWIREDLAAADLSGVTLSDTGLTPVGPVGGFAPDPSTARDIHGGVPSALAVFPAHHLQHRAGAVEIEVDTDAGRADLTVEARGVRSDGIWTEWRQAPDPTATSRFELPDQVDQVQVRVAIDPAAGPAAHVSGVRVRPIEGGAERRATPGAPQSSRVFTTRIGLVGDRTANGDTIRPNAHFAALPSRRGLAPKGTGDYTVRVCTPDSAEPRCVYVPVWDVGPWNIKDDYWNNPRESWTDLPQGKPQAQAANQEGYNRGLDGFGRRVANPAGIDLADGAFWEGLRLRTNAWVTVDYLWTGRYAHRAEVGSANGSDPVIVRSGPSTSHDDIGLAAHRANVDVACQATGTEVTGPQGTSDTWYRIGTADYLPASFVSGGSEAPSCAEAAVEPEEPTGYAPSCPAAPKPVAPVEPVRPCGGSAPTY
ncbi:hypothetical protein Nans01_12070 [Nocardiopsis ansamitocini]|uniref:Secreted protein n=2 Tax=Nocardiopsis ansamitocini TaxID=1670832 RepID=A0A9W6P478_9ACTN|nr:hypothetical protein Nans01_12070 [Nocardiopsis ansamitocini]